MKYFIVDNVLKNGVYELDIDYNHLISAVLRSDGKYIVKLNDAAEIRTEWQIATEIDYNNALPQLTLNNIKAFKIIELEQSYFGSFSTFQSSALGVLKTYPINAEAQDNLRDLQNRLIADPNKTTFYFKTIEDGTLVAHTRAQFLQLMQDAETYKVNQTTHFDSKVLSVNSATTADAVNAITW